jgi:glutathione peroxidase
MIIKIAIVALLLIAAAGVALAYKYGFILNPSPSAPPKEKSVYEFTMKDIDGQDVKLDAYRGKVVMIVNVASKCGFTPQYDGLEALYQKYRDQGFVILGFPANNFLSQEPGTEAEIKEFCSTKYHVTFPMFAKVSVTGTDQHPLYTLLTNRQTDPEFGGDISWNFNKFLLDRNGNIVARFGSKDTPESDGIKAAVEKYLALK